MQVTEFHNSEPILSMSGHTLSVVLKSHVVLIGAVGSERIDNCFRVDGYCFS